MARAGRILILGGGLGGLSATIELRRVGFEVALFEQSTELREARERLRVEEHHTPIELPKEVVRAEIDDGNLRLSRMMLKNLERDAFDRSGLASALLKAGLLEEGFARTFG